MEATSAISNSQDERFAMCKLQTYIRAFIYHQFKDTIKTDVTSDDVTTKTKWNFISINSDCYNNLVVPQDPILNEYSGGGCVTSILKKIDTTTLPRKLNKKDIFNKLYHDLLQYRLDTYPQSSSTTVMDAKDIYENQVKELDARIFFHDPNRISGHRGCLICNIYGREVESRRDESGGGVRSGVRRGGRSGGVRSG